MGHIAQTTLELLFSEDRDPNVVLCVHAVQSRIPDAGEEGQEPPVTVRVVGHVIPEDVEEVPEGLELPADLCFVLDLPMDAPTLASLAGHFGDTMDSLTDEALDALFDDKDR